MKENNIFYQMFKNEQDWKPITFTVFNYLENDGFIPSINGIYKQNYSMGDFVMKVIPLTKEDIDTYNDDKQSTLRKTIDYAFLSIEMDELVEFKLPFPKVKGFILGKAVVFIKLVE